MRVFRDAANQTVKPEAKWSGVKNSLQNFTDDFRVAFGKLSAGVATDNKIDILDLLYSKLAMNAMPKSTFNASRSGAIHYQKHINDWIVNDIEVCFKLDEGWELLPKAINETINCVEYWIKEKHTNPVNVAMEFRVTRGCRSALMSPAYTSNENAYYVWVEVLGTANYPDWWMTFGADMRKRWLALDTTAKPHWCKWWEPEGTKNGWIDAMKERYADEIAEFKDFVNDRDPGLKFRTKFWNNILSGQ